MQAMQTQMKNLNELVCVAGEDAAPGKTPKAHGADADVKMTECKDTPRPAKETTGAEKDKLGTGAPSETPEVKAYTGKTYRATEERALVKAEKEYKANRSLWPKQRMR